MDTPGAAAEPSLSIFCNVDDYPLTICDIGDELSLAPPWHRVSGRLQRHCLGNSRPGEFPLATSPSIALHILSSCKFDPIDLANLEATCKFFRKPALMPPDVELSLPELAALDICRSHDTFKSMTADELQSMKQRCGGSWKLLLRYINAGERCCRRGVAQVIAGPGHSVVVAASGAVYSFGANASGQLGHGTAEQPPEGAKPCLIRALGGIKIVHAAVGTNRTFFVSDAGRVYRCGKQCFGEPEHGVLDVPDVVHPTIVESLKDLYVVQVTVGRFFTAVLTREGWVYTLSWGRHGRLGHATDTGDTEPRRLSVAIDDAPVVQIAAGNCYLLMLVYEPTGMSVFSLGCGLGGKLGHCTKTNELQPRRIERFWELNMEPVSIAAGTWHAVALGHDGRVCTWGWGYSGCLGHGVEDSEDVPKVVEGLNKVNVVHIAAGEYTTFAISNAGDIYSFGLGESLNLGHQPYAPAWQFDEEMDMLTPELVEPLKVLGERAVQVSPTNGNSWDHGAHTLALTESGKVYSFGAGFSGQLGVKLEGIAQVWAPRHVAGIDLQ